MTNRYQAKTVTFLRTVECAHWMSGDPSKRYTMLKGWVIGNVLGHRGGVEVIEYDDGTLYLHMHAEFGESWRGVPADAVQIVRETTEEKS